MAQVRKYSGTFLALQYSSVESQTPLKIPSGAECQLDECSSGAQGGKFKWFDQWEFRESKCRAGGSHPEAKIY